MRAYTDKEKLDFAIITLESIRERCSGYYLIEKTQGMTTEDALRKEIEVYREHRSKCWKSVHDFLTHLRINELHTTTEEKEQGE